MPDSHRRGSPPTTDQRTIVRSYLVISGLFTLSASLIWGINTLFLLDAGLTILEVFIANAAFTAAMALFEIPTGVVADTRGRRASFLLAGVTLAIGTLAYVVVPWFGGGLVLFSAAGVILALGYAFYSGAVEAWLVDALRASGHRDGLEAVFSRAGVVAGFATVGGTIGGGILGQLDLAIPYVVRAALLGAALVVGFRAMHDVGFSPRALRIQDVAGEVTRVAQTGITFGVRAPAMRLLVMQSFVATGFSFWAWYAWPPYFLGLLGADAIWVAGVVAALISGAGIAGSLLAGRLSRVGRRRTTILIAASSVLTVAMVATGVVQSFWVTVPIFLLGAVASGVIRPVRQAFLHESIPSSERATLVSFDALVGSLGGIAGQTGLGYLSQARSIPGAFVVGGLATLLVLPIFARLRALDAPADRVGSSEREAGTDGSVAAAAARAT